MDINGEVLDSHAEALLAPVRGAAGPPSGQDDRSRPAAAGRYSGLTALLNQREIAMSDAETRDETDIVTKLSSRSVTDTVSLLTEMVGAKGMKVFTVIDQSAEARQVGLELRETILVIFGSPTAGTPVMAASPLAALDLPLKVLVWADGTQTKVSYHAPGALAIRHHLSTDLARNLAGIDALTDALVAPYQVTH